MERTGGKELSVRSHMYPAIIVHWVWAKKSIIILEFQQEFIFSAEKLELHGCCWNAYHQLQLTLIDRQRKAAFSHICQGIVHNCNQLSIAVLMTSWQNDYKLATAYFYQLMAIKHLQIFQQHILIHNQQVTSDLLATDLSQFKYIYLEFCNGDSPVKSSVWLELRKSTSQTHCHCWVTYDWYTVIFHLYIGC